MTRGSFCTLSISPSAMTLSFVQHHDAPGNGSNEGHIVLDNHHRVLARQRQQEFGRALDLVRRHAGHRLVHQQQLRVLHQQHADFEPLLLAVREDSSQCIALLREADDVEDLVDSLMLRRAKCGRAAFSGTTGCRPAPVRGSRIPSTARTPSVSETCGRFRRPRFPASDILSRSMSLPNRAVPESGRVFPVMTSIMVVLPAPLGPMMQSISPGSTCSESLLSALKPSKLTVRSSR